MKGYRFALGLMSFTGFSLGATVLRAEAETATREGGYEQIWTDLKLMLSDRMVGISYGEMLTSFVILVVSLLLRRVIAHGLFVQLKRLAGRTAVTWDDGVIEALEKPTAWFIGFVGVFLAFLQLPLGAEVNTFVIQLFQAITIAIVFWAIIRLMEVVTDVMGSVARKKGHSIGTFMPLINRALRIFLLMLALAIIVQNFGYDIGPVLGALGIGGAAFAFAAKDTIANLYGSFALAMDRPFRVGDWIMIGDEVDGNVEEIGLRSTKVRTWPKTVMSIPNHVLANSNINNWSRMPKRRVKQYIGVTYESTPDQMEGLVEDIRRILREDEGVQQEFVLVNFTDFGGSSLDILVYYFTKSIQWLEHMDVRQRVNIKIMKAVRERGMSVAFPTRTLYLEGDIARKMAGMPGDAGLPGDAGPDSPP